MCSSNRLSNFELFRYESDVVFDLGLVAKLCLFWLAVIRGFQLRQIASVLIASVLDVTVLDVTVLDVFRFAGPTGKCE